MHSASGSGPTVLALIAAGDLDAAAGFYDGRAPTVREYFVELCDAELVDEATLAAFVDFRGRAAVTPPDADADDILRRAARAAAAARMDLPDACSADCRATAELLVARMNGELIRGEEALQRHLKRCSICRRTAERLTDADPSLIAAGGEAPPNQIRAAWLELVGQEALAERGELAVATEAAGENGAAPGWVALAGEQREAGGSEPAAGHEPEPVVLPDPAAATPAHANVSGQGPTEAEAAQSQAAPSPKSSATDQPQPPAAIRVRARRGGLIGAARRLGFSSRRHQ